MSKNKKIGKIKFAFDDVLFKGNKLNGHHVYVSAHDKRTDKVLVNVVTSIVDKSGLAKPNALRQIKLGMLIPISSTKSSFQRFSGIKLEGLDYNNKNSRSLMFSDLSASKMNSSINSTQRRRIQKFIFDNKAHPGLSKQNREKAKFR